MSAPILTDGIKVVALAATPEALSATSQGAKWLLIAAHEDNTGVCWLGASTVVGAADGTQRGFLVPEVIGDTLQPLMVQGPLDLADVYIDVATNGDSVYFAYLPFGIS